MRALYGALVASLAFAANAAGPACPKPPAGWSGDRRNGADFHVCYYHHRMSRATLGAYRGSHPSFRPPPDALGIAGEIGARPTTWYRNLADGPFLHYETVVALDCNGYVAHAWAMGNTLEELEQALHVAAKLPLAPVPEASTCRK